MSPARLLLLLLPLLSFFLLRPASAILCHPEDKEVLLRIKSALNNPYHLASWDPNTDCCYWYCLKCHYKTHRVISLFFLQDNLTGTRRCCSGGERAQATSTSRGTSSCSTCRRLSLTRA
ncbi:hypothetical protein BT93_A1973 [Corymbia citriodora subsp. variegata]|nr:hypothetical protein BT93_A1973 [Corymbia citriodora subsp. variegata]